MALPTASDNVFPKILISEGAEPASPPSGQAKLFVDVADGLFKWKASDGTVREIGTASSSLDAIIAASSGQDIADALAGAASPDAGNVFATMADVGGGGGGGALVLLEQHTASSSATLDFTTCISSTYDDYLIEIVALAAGTAGQDLYFRCSTDGGSSYDATSGHYAFECFAWSAAATAVDGSTSATAIALNRTTDHDGTAIYNGTFRFFGPALSARKDFIGRYRYVNNAGSHQNGSIGGEYNQTAAVNAFRFLMSSGNIASGTIRCYGIAKT